MIAMRRSPSKSSSSKSSSSDGPVQVLKQIKKQAGNIAADVRDGVIAAKDEVKKEIGDAAESVMRTIREEAEELAHFVANYAGTEAEESPRPSAESESP